MNKKSTSKKTKPVSPAIRYLVKRYIGNDPKRLATLDRERINADIAQQIYDLRTAHHLTQREFARRVGTTASVISRLEDADYRGHSLTTLRRIAEASSGRRMKRSKHPRLYTPTPAEVRAIRRGRAQIARGEYLTLDELRRTLAPSRRAKPATRRRSTT